MKKKLMIIRAHGQFKVGDAIEVDGEQALQLMEDGIAQPPAVYAEIQASKAREEAAQQRRLIEGTATITASIDRAVKRGALKPKDDTFKAAKIERFTKGLDSCETIVELIDNLRTDEEVNMEDLTQRTMHASRAGGSVEFGSDSLKTICDAVFTARQPMNDLMRRGKGEEAAKISASTAKMLKVIQAESIRNPAFHLSQVIKASNSDTADPNSQIGTLSSTLLLMRNLGFLKNKINFMDKISTDLSAEPIKFGQSVQTRYITPPGVLTFVPGVGYTSDATTINAYIANRATNQAAVGPAATAIAATASSGTQTLSVPGATDVNVVINNDIGTEISFPTTTLGATVRNLFAEQQGAQVYSLAEMCNKIFLATVFGSTWSGVNTAALSLGQNFGLSGVIKIKTLFAINKMPDLGRFSLLHTVYHDQILTDATLLTAKAIMSLINKDASAMESGELPTLFGIKVLESQLAAWNAGLTDGTITTAMKGLVTPTDPTTIGTTAPSAIGFAGNSASAVMAARVPVDYTQALKDIPSTAAIEVVTDPDSGLSMMVTKFVNHATSAVNCRVSLMVGFAQGDPRQGFLLKP